MPRNLDDNGKSNDLVDKKSDTSEVISTTEMEIRTDVQEVAPNGEVLSSKIASAIQGIMLGMGAYSLSYWGIRNMELEPVSSLLARTGIGAVTGSTFAYGMYKLVASIQKSKIRAALHAVLGAAAIGGLGGPLLATFVDFEKNLALADEIKATKERLNSYAMDPRLVPDVANIESSFYRDVISDLDANGALTQKALTKLLIYEDGKSIQFNPRLDPVYALEGSWDFEIDGNPWTVGYFDPDNWLVKGEKTTWWIGENSEYPSIQGEFDKKSFGEKSYIELKELLDGSGKIDGRSVTDELISEAGEVPEIGNLDQGLDKLNVLAPTEWNDNLREEIRENATGIETQFVHDYSLQIRAGYEKMFGTQGDYLSLLNSVSQSQ